jgi:cytochrome c peroxidase
MTDHRLIKRHSMAGLQKSAWRFVAVLCLLWVLGTGWGAGPTPQTSAVMPEPQEPLLPLPLTVAVDPARVTLGAQLFHDVRLSGQNTMACATCHQLARGGADG